MTERKLKEVHYPVCGENFHCKEAEKP